MSNRKTIIELLSAPQPHWVGDGFPVRSMFSVHAQDAAAISPFLLLDYVGPKEFPLSKSGQARGVDQHPHRGFETVTIVYQGEIEHRDSAGDSGRIGPGDVQWMTAAAGIVHEEKHGTDFTKRGGTLEMIQLWVNLPAREKQAQPRYHEILSACIPTVDLPGGAALRVIAGEFNGTRGPAKTVTPMNVWDMNLRAGAAASFDLSETANTILLVLRGSATINDTQIGDHQGIILSREGRTIEIRAAEDAMILLLSGEPIDEPVIAHGPFVMNTHDEIKQAMSDYRNGRMGMIEPVEVDGARV